MKRLISIFLTACLMACLTALPAMAEPGDPYAPPANLAALSQAEQLAYFNLVANRARAEKPGFKQREKLYIESFRSSLLGGALDSLINSVVKQLMPGDWKYQTIANSQDNKGLFLSDNANASDLTAQDITSITSTKQGDNWVIVVGVAEAINPAKGTASSIGRISPVATREDIIEDLAGSGLFAEVANTTLRYHNAYAGVIVNPDGKVLFSELGFLAEAAVKGASLATFTFDVTANQSAKWQYAAFDWTDAPMPLPTDDAPIILPPTGPWYTSLPPWMQWILRWIFFGWIWM